MVVLNISQYLRPTQSIITHVPEGVALERRAETMVLVIVDIGLIFCYMAATNG
jgi:hypothetical protein